MGVKFIACQMAMDMMGIKKEELIDEVDIGGVATYLEAAEEQLVLEYPDLGVKIEMHQLLQEQGLLR